MRRATCNRKEHALLICLMLAAIAAMFPLAVPEKTLTLAIYCLTSVLGLLLALTRLQILAMPVAFSFVMLVASFFTPIEIDFARNRTFRLSWERCVVVGSFDRDRATGAERVIYRGCCPINGIEPVRLLTINVP
jgi:hypothetical protein